MEKEVIIGSDYHVKFIGADSIELFESYYAPEFNKKYLPSELEYTLKTNYKQYLDEIAIFIILF